MNLDLGNRGFIPNVVVLQQDLKQAPLPYLTCVFFMLLHSLTKNIVKQKETEASKVKLKDMLKELSTSAM